MRRLRLSLLGIVQLHSVENLRSGKQEVQQHTGQHGLPDHSRSVPVLALPDIIPGHTVDIDIASLQNFSSPFVIKLQTKKPSKAHRGPDEVKDAVRIPEKLAEIELATLTTTSLKGRRIISGPKLEGILP